MFEKEDLWSESDVLVCLGNEGFISEVMVCYYSLIVDEFVFIGGNDFGFMLYELFSVSFGVCIVMIL